MESPRGSSPQKTDESGQQTNAPMEPDRLLSLVPESIVELGRRIQDFNYEYEIYGLGKEVDGIRFRDYNFVGPSSETLLSALIAQVGPGEVVYDAGASVGHYTLPLATKGCVVYAFEPNPAAFERLDKNIDANGDPTVEPFNLGLSNEDGTADFHVSSVSTVSSFHREHAGADDATVTATAEVDVRTIDSLVFDEGLRPPDHLKIDVEGLGLEVLQGSKRTIETHRPRIYFEPHVVEQDGEQTKRTEELRSFFESMNYEIHEFDQPCWICVHNETANDV